MKKKIISSPHCIAYIYMHICIRGHIHNFHLRAFPQTQIQTNSLHFPECRDYEYDDNDFCIYLFIWWWFSSWRCRWWIPWMDNFLLTYNIYMCGKKSSPDHRKRIFEQMYEWKRNIVEEKKGRIHSEGSYILGFVYMDIINVWWQFMGGCGLCGHDWGSAMTKELMDRSMRRWCLAYINIYSATISSFPPYSIAISSFELKSGWAGLYENLLYIQYIYFILLYSVCALTSYRLILICLVNCIYDFYFYILRSIEASLDDFDYKSRCNCL